MTAIRALAGVLCLLLAPSLAWAVTIDQIVAMSKAGVSDAVIVAMIEHDKTVFVLDPAQLVELQQAGVSDTVAVAMIKSDGRAQPSVVSPTQPGVASEQPAAPYPGAVAYPGMVTYPAAVTYPDVVAYAVPIGVSNSRRRSHVVVAAPVVPVQQVQQLHVQPVTSPRGMFFSQPATGIFFPPPAADCPPPAASPRRR